MAKAKGLLNVQCPCCDAMLRVDPETRAVISHQAAEKPRAIEDFSAAVALQKGEADRRAEAFRKSVAEHKVHGQVLDKKFDELLKQAKDDRVTPPKRLFDLD